MSALDHTPRNAPSIPELLRGVGSNLEGEALTSSSSSRKEQLSRAEANNLDILSRLRSAINTCAPIHSLPAEIITTILHHVMADTIPRICLPISYLNSDFLRRQHYLKRLVLVCRAWRDLVFNSSLIWSHILGGSPTMIDLSIQRSRSAPLSFYLVETYARSFCMSDRIQEHCDRLRGLHIDRREFVLPCGRVVSPWTEFKAPRLECFTCIGKEPWKHPLESRVEMQQLFIDHVSSLKALALVDHGHWLPSNLFPRLTHLYLSPTLYGFTPLLVPWLDGLLEVLSNAPLVKILHIRLPNPELEPPASPSSRRSVNLLQLRVFTLQSRSPPLAWYILSHLSIPTDTLVRFHWRSVMLPNNDRPTMHTLSPYTTLVVSVMSVHITDVLLTNACINAGLWVQQLAQKPELAWQSFLSNLHTTCPLTSVECMRLYADGSDVIPIAGISFTSGRLRTRKMKTLGPSSRAFAMLSRGMSLPSVRRCACSVSKHTSAARTSGGRSRS
ncbi:hypothetical protein L226DRAFT_537840 [Lentinus tigrinus ALCF2SS1-7]|uniref:Uncharacterized protein n=1 Tax=Lentinus tigrinus ALCF2SS1-6 TaxID=1328759 RepID=A0A5C2S047_9APHY|nr:hypothetical protein L227DRAFT_578661 [Lentinus tigrinus ALCF2SS1-6]RPD71568.1 hypothetical protein L226DRAFT_537840 [Lentinus tigrinus ALCF2SS1-7]